MNWRGLDDATARRWARLRARHLPAPADWGVLGVGADGLITFVNAAAAAMLGHSPQCLLGQPVALACGARHGMAGPDSAWSVHGALRDGLIRQTDNDTFCRADGARFAVEYTVLPQVEEGAVLGAVLLFADLDGRLAR